MKFPLLYPKSLQRARVDLDLAGIRRFLVHRSLVAKWEQHALCPCIGNVNAGGLTGYSFEGRTDCSECRGNGILYHSAQSTRVMVQGATRQAAMFRQYGEYADQMVRVTWFPENKPAKFDRITLVDATVVEDEIGVRTAATVEQLRHPVATPENMFTGGGADQVTPVPVDVGVTYCRVADDEGTLYPDPLVEGTDFEVTAAGDIDWTLGDGLGSAPTVGERYSMKYFTNPVYVVWNFPHVLRAQYSVRKSVAEQFQVLPVHVDCRRIFLRHRGIGIEEDPCA